MKNVTSYIGMLAIAGSLAACGSDPVSLEATTGGGQSLAVARFGALGTMKQGAPSDTAQRAVITDAASWTRFWGSLAPDPAASMGGPPAVDFSTNMVIAAVMPLRTSGGYRIEIEKVTEWADRIEAQVVSYAPGPDCATTAIVTRPFDVVQVPRRDKRVTFVERSVVGSCSTSLRTDTVRAAFGKTVASHGVNVTLVKVVSDSRCPMNALCIWEGDAAVTLRFEQSGRTADVTLHTSPKGGVVSVTTNGAEFRLAGLTPFPVAGQSPAPETAYTAVLAVR